METAFVTRKNVRKFQRLLKGNFTTKYSQLVGVGRPIPLIISLTTYCVFISQLLMAAEKPRIAFFSGPTATIQNSQPLITSNKAREKHDLPLIKDSSGQPLSYDMLFPQRLATPVTIYIKQFSAHPLESDVSELYAAPDGYINSQGDFHTQQQSPSDIPVYKVILKPKDGLYPLPYMAIQADGKAWNGTATEPGAPFSRARQTFYPDASRTLEEIERNGGGIYSMADYDFFRPSPPGGYTKGLPSSQRTDQGKGNIPPERHGEHFFTYGPYNADAPRSHLARVTNMVQKALNSGLYKGAIWLEGSPNIEDTVYWLNLLIDTNLPIVGNAAQRKRGLVSADGDGNIVDAIHYITSEVWADDKGRNRMGAVLIQAQQIFSSREVQKEDARPGGYVSTGGHGGIVGSTGMDGPRVTFFPNRKHTYLSELRSTILPSATTGVRKEGSKVWTVTVPIKNSKGEILPSAIPLVTIIKGSRWHADPLVKTSGEEDMIARRERHLTSYPLSGIVAEGLAPYGKLVASMEAELRKAVLSGIPVVKAARGNAGGFMKTDPNNLFIEGQNMTATKARMLLMASIMKLGMLPPATNPDKPTKEEIQAIQEKVEHYQKILHTH